MQLLTDIKSLEKAVLGRCAYDETGALELSWSLAGFAVRFIGERAIVHFRADYALDVAAYLKVEIDGREGKYGIIDGREKIVLDGLGEGEHMLVVRRASAGELPVKVSAFEIMGAVCEILPPPEMPKLKMQFFGDSITCGFGVLADSATTPYSTSDEDATKTYAYLTAKSLGADIRVCAISGQGIVCNCAGEHGTLFSEFYAYETRNGKQPHDFKSWVPDIVVINGGTNDNGGGASEEAFEAGARDFIARVRAAYPAAHIFWMYGLMGQRYDELLLKLIGDLSENDKRLYYVPITPITAEERGAVSHPNLVGQARGTAVLTAAIREAMQI